MTASLFFRFSLVVSLLLAIACKKQPQDVARPTASLGYAKGAGADCASGVKLECGMPVYQDNEHFEQVYDCLQAAYDSNLDAFEAAYGSLSEDDYEDMAIQTGFVDEEPLIDFETAMGYTSYRADLASLENNWLALGGDPQTNPYAEDVFVDEILATMFNKSGAAMIGSVIVYYASNGDVYEIPAADCSLYECILLDPENCDLSNVVVFKGGSATSPCGQLFAEEDSTEFYSSEPRYVFWKMKHNRIGGLGNKFIYRSEIRAYKWKNGGYKPRRTPLAASQAGIAHHEHQSPVCKDDSFDNVQPALKRKVRKNKYKFVTDIDYAVSDESVKTNFYFTGWTRVDRLNL